MTNDSELQLTYEIAVCGQSSGDDEDKQQLLLDFFLSRCAIALESFSSSFVAGKHRGGGGNFFDRDEKLVVDEFVSIRNRLIWIQRFFFFFLLLWTTICRQPVLTEKEREKEKHYYEDKFFFFLQQNINMHACLVIEWSKQGVDQNTRVWLVRENTKRCRLMLLVSHAWSNCHSFMYTQENILALTASLCCLSFCWNEIESST